MEELLKQIVAKLDRVEKVLAEHGQKFDDIDVKVQDLEAAMKEMFITNNQSFNILLNLRDQLTANDSGQDILEGRMRKVEKDVNILKKRLGV